ncbi:MAG: hypothetical protein JKY26_01515 [Pseudomonas sp.]|nr:hypothetical protein [Pseudomonas sp.]
MDILDIQVALDGIAEALTDSLSHTPDDIREFFTNEGARIAQEIEEEEERQMRKSIGSWGGKY